MKLYAQQGYGTGSGDRDKVIAGLAAGYIQGAIISPKDYGIDRATELLERMEGEHADADRLFDPQFYASVMAHDADGRLGKLLSSDYEPYFEPRRRSQLESESRVRDDLRACLGFQAGLAVTAAIAPNIVIRQRFNSIEAVISKNFIRNARQAWNDEGDDRPLFVTLAMDAEALQERHELEEFLSDITVMDEPPDGFYLLVNNPTSDIASELVDARTLAGWMMMNHSLQLNGFQVINGFSDILTPFLCAAGGTAGATGWFNTQKVFSLNRFAPPAAGGMRPVPRYLSKGLLNSIRFDELHRLRGRFPNVLNGLPTDANYDLSNGSQPDDQLAEVLQTWDAISSFATPVMENCNLWIERAESLYNEINLNPGLRLMGRSNDAHLYLLRGGVALFAELAEIDL
ncbi:MAG TPA: hypothetical protein DIT64_18150 [Verrucomicrobiales bacterium]|nr:hypothetical protein [Verrucomicrobiales bacterium]